MDGSFLRMETGYVQTQMGFSTVWAAPTDRPRPSIEAWREQAASRLDTVPWSRWKLDGAPLGLSEPRWVADHNFDLRAHVVALTEQDDEVSRESFEALRDMFFSTPLDRRRPLWQFALVPRLRDGRVGCVGQVHHSLVDGIGAMQFAAMIFDGEPDPGPPAPSSSVSPWRPPSRAGRLGWAIDSLTQTLDAGAVALREAAAVIADPQATADRVLRRARLLADTVRDDVLPPAPASGLNATIGARRTLVGYWPRRADLLAARTNGGGTFNDIGVAIVAGAMRRLALQQGDPGGRADEGDDPGQHAREIGDRAAGNRLAMVTIPLPTHLESPREASSTSATRCASSSTPTGPPRQGSSAPPRPCCHRRFAHRSCERCPGPASSTSWSPISTPRGSLYLLGCELEELYTAVPITRGHTLAIGFSRYRRELFVACYADPDALPEVHDLPALMEAELHALMPAAATAAVR